MNSEAGSVVARSNVSRSLRTITTLVRETAPRKGVCLSLPLKCPSLLPLHSYLRRHTLPALCVVDMGRLAENRPRAPGAGPEAREMRPSGAPRGWKKFFFLLVLYFLSICCLRLGRRRTGLPPPEPRGQAAFFSF